MMHSNNAGRLPALVEWPYGNGAKDLDEMPDQIRVELYAYWDVVAVLENNQSQTDMLQEKTFHNRDEALRYAARLAKEYGVGVTHVRD